LWNSSPVKLHDTFVHNGKGLHPQWPHPFLSHYANETITSPTRPRPCVITFLCRSTMPGVRSCGAGPACIEGHERQPVSESRGMVQVGLMSEKNSDN